MDARRISVPFMCGLGLLTLSACAPGIAPPLACTASTGSSAYAAIAQTPHTQSATLRVATYRVIATRKRVHPCGELALRKEVVLARGASHDIELWEVREFFAGDGTFIARNRENVTAQLTDSGHYAGTLVLPIPDSTPAGRYRVVARLIGKQNGRERLLAMTTAEFQVAR